MTALYTHNLCLQHQPGPGHPESPARLHAVLEALDQDVFAALDRIEARPATRAQLERAHTAELISSIFAQSPQHDCVHLDPDTVMSPHSLSAALHAAGAVSMAIDAVIAGRIRRAFCAVRPPGHHATHDTAMGFCLFNNIAVGAAHALAVHGLERVAIVDFDVHHGNGTQDIFWNDSRVLYISSHQFPLYPGTGARNEIGAGNIVNAPLAPGAGSAEFRQAYEEILLPALDRFAPQLVLISAGFDAHRLDPLANLNLETNDYAWITQRLVEIAERHAQGRIVSSLEGGYSLTALRQSSAAHVQALLG
ncbi:histone deacetylase family protein [Pseudolysobacter antarcticus]|uniref:Histone deacetylase family protein n=1 Tax=Pseudolysobacter antarcticus TaxID=2511995 RepID=A0A411HQ44_9GAMM|nr:histone deacetylase family protein [Pseudolysobacter antarcticus]QBB72582.1 histone deacetylase family protein [Pseudolysobacter antarcticus]